MTVTIITRPMFIILKVKRRIKKFSIHWAPKDLTEAQRKQQELDLQYDKEKNNNSSLSSLFTNLINTQTMVVIFFTMIVTTVLNNYFFFNLINSMHSMLQILEK